MSLFTLYYAAFRQHFLKTVYIVIYIDFLRGLKDADVVDMLLYYHRLIKPLNQRELLKFNFVSQCFHFIHFNRSYLICHCFSSSANYVILKQILGVAKIT